MQPLRVLLVGVDRVGATLAARMIERLGHPAPRREETLDAPPDDCDVLMFDADALELTRLPLPAGIAVIAASADDNHGAILVDAWLRKPLQLAALGAALDEARRPVWNELLRLFGRDGVAEMLAALRRDLPQQQQQIGQALEQDDRQALRRCAHSLRGVGLQFGAAVFAGLCAQVEQTQDAALAARMRSAYAELVQGLEDRLRGR